MADNYIRHYGREEPKRRVFILTPAEKLVLDLREEGLSFRAIKRHVGYSLSVIRNIYKRGMEKTSESH